MNHFEYENMMKDHQQDYGEKEPKNKRKRSGWKPVLGIALTFAVCVTGSGALSYQVAKNTVAETASQSTQDSAGTTVQATGMSTGSDGTGISSVVEDVVDSVVEVSTEMKQVSNRATEYVTEGAGSGVIISENGTIVTNHHVIDGATSITVRTTDGTEYEAALIASDEKTDVAVLKVEATGLTYASFADSSSLKVGDSVIAIGNPLGELGGTVTEGIISALDREVTIDNETMTLLQTSAAVSPGNSGGGLFDLNGGLIGIVNAKSSGSDVEGLAFAIPSSTVQEVVVELIENGYVTGRPQLGISVTETGSMQGMMMNPAGTGESGVYISSVSMDNGLQTGDRIVSINGTEITAASDVQEIIDACQVGDTVRVVVLRGAEQAEVAVTLTEYTPVSDTALQAA